MTYITNLVSDPRCLKKKEVWTSADGGVSANVTVVQDPKTRLWTYTTKSWYNLFPFVGTGGVFAKGSIGVALLSDTTSVSGVESGAIVERGDGWIAADYSATGNWTLTMKQNTTVTLMGSAVYTPEDWRRVKALVESGDLPTPWFWWGMMPIARG